MTTTPTTPSANGARHLEAVNHYPDEPPPDEPGFDTRRPLPQAIEAEQSVLGAMLLSRQAITDAIDVLQPHDFYRPPHETIWDAITGMHTAGQPVDAVTVAAHLTTTKQLAKVGGAPYLHTLISTVPTAANAAHYARIVRERAEQRRLVEAGTKITQLGYAAGGDITDLQHAATKTLERATTGQPATGGTPSTWQPVDLEPFLYGEELATIPPSLLARSDGACLLYAGAVHSISGEPGSGKSWFALMGCLQQAAMGINVAYIDFEDRAARVVARLLESGALPAQVEQHFRYIRPETALSAGTAHHLMTAAEDCTLAVIDGVTEAMGLHGLSLLDNEDVARFMALLPRRIANLGPAVLQIDHVVKNAESRGRYAIGGQHKLAAIDGCAFKAEIIEKFGRGKRGRSLIVLDKDREGHVEALATGPAVATLTLDSTPTARHDSGQLRMYLDPPPTGLDDDPGTDPRRPVFLMGRVCAFLATTPGASQTAVERGIRGNSTQIRAALTTLITEGYVRVEQTGNTRRHHLERHYLQDDE